MATLNESTYNGFIPGMRIELRDAEWRIDRVDVPSHGGMLLTCTGHSELVRGRTAKFLTDLEDSPRILSPETTALVDDTSAGYSATQLYLHAVMQTTPPSDERIHLGHQAAIDVLPYQLDPALQALAQTRPRILIADAVGLGKTIGAGILTTELIQRGRGKRILVLAVKSMLAQFQREMWQRFTVPLVRLDSLGLQRMRNRIPTNHNPFHYFERAIISIDTLKQNLEYRDYLEKCHWDIVIIDEAHNVAERSSNSLRTQLARLLCRKCDAMIMLSATPHDGRPQSFASLIHMLDPTAIPDPTDYGHEDYSDKGLVIRRFKRDVADQLATALPERVVHRCKVPASDPENQAWSVLREAKFRTLNRGSAGAGQLFRTTLEKALLSSPAACLSTANKRIERLRKRPDDEDVAHDINQLQQIADACESISPAFFSKLQLLVGMLSKTGHNAIGWDIKAANDRVVVFTESVVTLKLLEAHLPAALGLSGSAKKQSWAVLHGSMKDIDLINTVNEFNRPQSPLRLLLCSDVASEGLNLHHCSFRLVHFDIPWSLMVFQQRNGRIDRYGQQRQPEIYYLLSEAGEAQVQGDHRVLEVLIEKDDQASRNLGDPSEFGGGGSVQEQEEATAQAIESGNGGDSLAALMDQMLAASSEGLQGFESAGGPSTHHDLPQVTAPAAGVYADTTAFMRAGLDWLKMQMPELNWSYKDGVIDLSAPADLQQLSRRLPREAIPVDFRYLLTSDRQAIMSDMALARDDETDTFGKLQYLWPQHPVVGWLMQRVQDAFGRHTAPVMRLPNQLASNEHWFIALGGFPNKRGQALIQDHLALQMVDDAVVEVLPLSDLLTRLNLSGSKLPARGEAKSTVRQAEYLPMVVGHVRTHLQRKREDRQATMCQRINDEDAALAQLRAAHEQQLELDLQNLPDSVKQGRRERRRSEISAHFDEYQRWLTQTNTTEDEPYIQIVAVITGDAGEPLV